MDLRHLRTFVAGGVRRATTRVHLPQPAISRQIRALELELGVPLFDRIDRRVHLTSEGEGLLRRSRRLLNEAEGLVERANALKRGEAGILRVGATPQVIENTLVAFLAPYAEQFIEELVAHCEHRYPGRELMQHLPSLPRPWGS